jgi:hypothetical protein
MDKNLKVIILPYIPAMVNEVELWLENQARHGWRLINKKHWVFRFTSCKPYASKYFIYYGFDASKGISFDFYMAKKKFGKAKALLNKGNSSVFEVDINKVDQSYYEYKKLRNHFYTTHYLKLLFASVIFLVVAIILAALDFLMLFLVVIWIAPLLYAIVSLLILKKTGDGSVS